MDSSSGNQEMGSQTLESVLIGTKPQQQEKKPRPSDEQALKCPRCESTNTKFCYYNNYSLTQPRYFCKSCRRYWTKGGTLRNVPVGGGCRKNRRSTLSSSSSSSAHNKIRSHEFILPNTISNNNNNSNPITIPLIPTSSSSYDHHSSCDDLSLAIARLQSQTPLGLFDEMTHDRHFNMWANPINMPSSDHVLGGMNSYHIDTSLGLFDRAFLDHQHGNNYYGSLISGAITDDMGLIQCEPELKQNVKDNNGRSNDNPAGGNDDGDDQTRVLWGFPWQVNGEGSNDQSFFDSNGRPSLAWNGIVGSSNNWHGLLNSPLM